MVEVERACKSFSNLSLSRLICCCIASGFKFAQLEMSEMTFFVLKDVPSLTVILLSRGGTVIADRVIQGFPLK